MFQLPLWTVKHILYILPLNTQRSKDAYLLNCMNVDGYY